MSPLDPTLTYYPRPSAPIRLAGISAILGAILWPVSLVFIGAGGIQCTAGGCSGDRGVLGFLALAPILLTVGLIGLELRAAREPGLVDLIGDLSIGTAAVLSALAFVVGTAALFLPGLLLLLIGSTIFGVGGYVLGGRPRLASVLVGIGAGAFLFFLIGGGVGVGGIGDATVSTCLIIFSLGWVWLGVDLLLARPLAIPIRKVRER